MDKDPAESAIIDLLMEWESCHEKGQSVSPEALCASCPELLDELERRIGILRAMKPPLRSEEGEDAEARGQTAEPETVEVTSAAPVCLPSEASCTARFVDLTPLAAGGLGVVYRAHAADLNREVALKFIRRELAGDPKRRRHFLREAEVTGRLEHPGVVPVYGLGADAEGHPCYAMRLVRGKTQNEAIREFHGDPAAHDSSERSLRFRELLRRFVTVCQTVAYAHSRGVIHRDIKPLNILHGPYGETLLVDWGLSRSIDQPDAGQLAEDAPPLEIPATMASTAGPVGTPGYMSPEQAAGEAAQIGPASDIFSLGAVLYAILTGRSPFQGSSLVEVIDHARRHQFSRPSAIAPEVHMALEAICLKAMARDRETRYASALDLAADIDRWLADEPVSAYREPLSRRVARWARRHRTAVAGGAVLLVTATVLSTTFGTLVLHAQARTEKALAQADTLYRMSSDVVETMLTRVGLDRLDRMPEDLQQVRETLLQDALHYQLKLQAQRPSDPMGRHDVARAYLRAAQIRMKLGHLAGVEADFRRGIVELTRLAALDPLVSAHRAELASGYHNLGHFLVDDGRPVEAESAYLQALSIVRGLVTANPTVTEFRQELVGVMDSLGVLSANLDRPEKVARAEGYYQEAQNVGEGLVRDQPVSQRAATVLVDVLGNRGRMLRAFGDLAEAERVFRRALEIQADLVARDPGKPDHQLVLFQLHESLGQIFAAQHRGTDADAAYRVAIEKAESLAAAFPSLPSCQQRLAMVLTNRANLLRQTKRLGEVETLLRRARGVQSALAAAYPRNPKYRLDLGLIHNSLANTLREDRRINEAETVYREALREVAPEGTAVGGNPDLQSTLGMILHNLAAVCSDQGRPEEALPFLLQAIDRDQAARAVDPRNTFYVESLSNHYFSMADTLCQLKRHEEAARAAEAMVAVFPQRADESLSAAQFLGRCVALARQSTGLSEARRSALADAYAGRAMCHLRNAVDRGFHDARILETSAELAPIRPRDDFRKLLESVKLAAGK